MLISVQQETNSTVRKKICDCTAEFARNMIGEYFFIFHPFTFFKVITEMYYYILKQSKQQNIYTQLYCRSLVTLALDSDQKLS